MSKSSTDEEEKQKATIQVNTTGREDEEEPKVLRVYFSKKSEPDLVKADGSWHTLHDADGVERLRIQYSCDKETETGTVNFDTKSKNYRGEIEITDEAGNALACFKCKDNGDITLNGAVVMSGGKVTNPDLLKSRLKNVQDVIKIDGVTICNPELEKGVDKVKAAVSSVNSSAVPAADPAASSTVPKPKNPVISV